MIYRFALFAAASLAALGMASGANAQAAKEPMTFFVSSVGSGKGADLGGLAGADAICQKLATDAGSTGMTWHAYLSTSSYKGGTIVNARDRIGNGPWYNAKGELIAKTLDELHGKNSIVSKQTALTEKAAVVNGRGDTPNQHDILTGSRPDGTALLGAADSTCSNWTSGADDGSAMLGHHDRTGLSLDPPMLSWNSAHPSAGCSQPKLVQTGGAGQLYCFAVR
jgi:hypothetical protein